MIGQGFYMADAFHVTNQQSSITEHWHHPWNGESPTRPHLSLSHRLTSGEGCDTLKHQLFSNVDQFCWLHGACHLLLSSVCHRFNTVKTMQRKSCHWTFWIRNCDIAVHFRMAAWQWLVVCHKRRLCNFNSLPWQRSSRDQMDIPG